MAIDYTTPVGKVRLLIADTDEAALLLSDEQLQALVDMALENSVHRAAAQALDIIATSETLIGKMIKTQDLQTNAPAVAAELRAQAAQLRETANEEDNAFFDVVTPDPYPPTYGEAGEFVRPLLTRGLW